MTSGEGWRDSRTYARLRGVDRAGLMWEWLRRDPGYIAWYAQASAVTRGSAGLNPAVEDPHLWGVHFRRKSGGRGPGRPDHLACRFRSGNAGHSFGASIPCASGRDRSGAARAVDDVGGRQSWPRARRSVGWPTAYPSRHRARESSSRRTRHHALSTGWPRQRRDAHLSVAAPAVPLPAPAVSDLIVSSGRRHRPRSANASRVGRAWRRGEPARYRSRALRDGEVECHER